MAQLINAKEWGHLATFVPMKKEPVYNWFYYKEGYSKQLVLNLLDRFQVSSGSMILDPFCGVGTTLLAAKQQGLQAVGFDVSPLAIFASRVKLADYDRDQLIQSAKKVFKAKFTRPEIDVRNKLVKRAFSKYALEDIVFYKEIIMQIPDEKVRNFILLALINASQKCSYATKDGGYIRIKKKKTPPVKQIFKRNVFRMIKELKQFETSSAEARVEVGDARHLSLDDNSVDCIITSPPYLNKIEYTKVYSIERALFFEDTPESEMRSYMGLDSTGERFIDEPLPPIAQDYFRDMDQIISEMARVCKPGAKIGIVVGNGCFPEGVVESDLIFEDIAARHGLSCPEILVLNERWCTKQRTIKIDKARESCVVLEKN